MKLGLVKVRWVEPERYVLIHLHQAAASLPFQFSRRRFATVAPFSLNFTRRLPLMCSC
jgi:hypothetical protein